MPNKGAEWSQGKDTSIQTERCNWNFHSNVGLERNRQNRQFSESEPRKSDQSVPRSRLRQTGTRFEVAWIKLAVIGAIAG